MSDLATVHPGGWAGWRARTAQIWVAAYAGRRIKMGWLRDDGEPRFYEPNDEWIEGMRKRVQKIKDRCPGWDFSSLEEIQILKKGIPHEVAVFKNYDSNQKIVVQTGNRGLTEYTWERFESMLNGDSNLKIGDLKFVNLEIDEIGFKGPRGRIIFPPSGKLVPEEPESGVYYLVEKGRKEEFQDRKDVIFVGGRRYIGKIVAEEFEIYDR